MVSTVLLPQMERKYEVCVKTVSQGILSGKARWDSLKYIFSSVKDGSKIDYCITNLGMSDISVLIVKQQSYLSESSQLVLSTQLIPDNISHYKTSMGYPRYIYLGTRFKRKKWERTENSSN